MNSLDKSFSDMAGGCEAPNTQALCKSLYFRPNQFSEESLTVGVLISKNSVTHLVHIVEPAAFEALKCLFGEEAQEQLTYSLKLLRHKLENELNGIDDIELPSDLLLLGKSTKVMCSNPADHAKELLQISSSLYRNYQCHVGSSSSIGQDYVLKGLRDSATQQNVILSTKLFVGKKVNLPNTKPIKVPIYGDKIIGAPISMVTKQVKSAKETGEAWVARFTVARKKLNRKPVLYVLLPTYDENNNQNAILDNTAELRLVAEENGVLIRQERSFQELASALLHDDAA